MASVNAALRLTEQLISCRSVTPADGGALALLAERLGGAGFACERLDDGPADARVGNLYAVHTGVRPGPTVSITSETPK